MGPCTSGSSQLLMPSFMTAFLTHSVPEALVSLFLTDSQHELPSGPLHFPFLLPGMLYFSAISPACSLSSFRSLLDCHLIQEAFPDWPNKVIPSFTLECFPCFIFLYMSYAMTLCCFGFFYFPSCSLTDCHLQNTSSLRAGPLFRLLQYL